MTSTQLPLVGTDLPAAFAARWAQLGGPALTGVSCSLERGRYTFTARVEGLGAFVYIRARDEELADCADDMFKRCAS